MFHGAPVRPRLADRIRVAAKLITHVLGRVQQLLRITPAEALDDLFEADPPLHLPAFLVLFDVPAVRGKHRVQGTVVQTLLP